MTRTKKAMHSWPAGPPTPGRINFVLLAVNDDETQETRRIFNLDHVETEEGLSYVWGVLEHVNGGPLIVALVSLDDRQGNSVSLRKTYEVVRILDPDYIVVLGIAGAFEESGIAVGDVVIGTLLYHGTIKDGSEPSLRSQPILPPSIDLVSQARKIDERKKWGEQDWRDLIAADRPDSESASNQPKVWFEEMLSTDILFARRDQEILQAVTRSYPRVKSFEMEAGGVAQALFALSEKQKAPGYIVVKGISDFPASDEEDSRNQNQSQRDKWKPYAANASAAFAKSLIRHFKPARRWPIPLKRVVPRMLHHTINDYCAGVLQNVGPVDYSRIASAHLRRLASHFGRSASTIFTVCAYHPRSLYNIARRVQQTDSRSTKDLLSWTKQWFPHFATFSDHARQVPGSCKRILLLDDFDAWTKDLQPEEWDFFRGLNGDVECWAVDRKTLSTRPRLHFVTDYAILGGDLVLDYYDESGTLIVFEVPAPEYGAGPLIELKEFFEEADKSTTSMFPFRPLELLNSEVLRVFESRKELALPFTGIHADGEGEGATSRIG